MYCLLRGAAAGAGGTLHAVTMHALQISIHNACTAVLVDMLEYSDVQLWKPKFRQAACQLRPCMLSCCSAQRQLYFRCQQGCRLVRQAQASSALWQLSAQAGYVMALVASSASIF